MNETEAPDVPPNGPDFGLDFGATPELWLLVLGGVATVVMLCVAVWLIRTMHAEDRAADAIKSEQGKSQ
jgi:hypothetical protein